MKFGSRMDVFLPPSAELAVRPGQQVVAGETVSPSTDLVAGWLASRLGVKVKRSPAANGPSRGSATSARAS